ncbi:MAG TPA: class IV adenylate cyclase [Tepidisphaeraceae bacterium]|nr:class IV adenylate cyclase [Tepidisphaeraceae bacterium]
MPVEIEAKMKVADHAPVRNRLQECGAHRQSSVLETNTFFDTPDRSLLAKDQGLRLRHQRDVQSHEEKSIITFKGPRQRGLTKNREEKEVVVGDPQDAIALLEAIGFSCIVSFQKKRETWLLEGCEIELDELPYLGTFVEIEGPSEQVILRVREILNLANEPMINAGYIALLMKHLQENQISEREIKFK